MRKAEKTVQELVRCVTSMQYGDMWEAVWTIIDLGQERERILPLIPYLPELEAALKEGPAVEQEWRLQTLYGDDIPIAVKSLMNKPVEYDYPWSFAAQVIRFHRDHSECPCVLYEAKGRNYGYRLPDQIEQGRVKLLEKAMDESGQYLDHYIVKCTRCGQIFKVYEREYHATWWEWIRL